MHTFDLIISNSCKYHIFSFNSIRTRVYIFQVYDISVKQTSMGDGYMHYCQYTIAFNKKTEFNKI